VAVQRGSVESTVVQANPATGGMRLDIAIVPPDEGPGEMRAELLRNGARVSEVWLYRRAMS
jgi:glucans biosynthesis protein